MRRVRHDDPPEQPITLERVPIPPIERPTAEELAKRKVFAAEADRLRELTGPIDISTSELIRSARGGGDGH